MGQKNTSLKKEADRVMQIKGNSRGEILRTHAVYIRQREGEEGIRAVEKKLEELGYPLKFKEVRPLAWYPEGFSNLIIFLPKVIFKWKDFDIFDMGNSAPKYSFVIKLLMKYFISLKRVYEESPKYWREHFDFGELEIFEFNEEKKYLIVRVKGYKLLPTTCIFFAGYFQRIGQFVTKNGKITAKETKCMFKKDPYHEYFIKWE